MDLITAIRTRRSVRQYSSRKIGKEIIKSLVDAAIQAPSASNSQPWAFAVLQDSALLKEYSDRAKKHLLSSIDQQPSLAKYNSMLTNTDFNIFYNASTLVIIFAKPQGLHSHGDCCLAAQNLMLSACNLGLGTCWIGLARTFLELPETKAELGIPAEYSPVAPIIVGYPEGNIPQLTRNSPEIIVWRD